jgi:hypothetical protein
MEQISGFTALPARRLTALYELDALLVPAVGIDFSVLPPTDLLGRGFRWAHHSPVVGRVVGPDGEDATEQLRRKLGRRLGGANGDLRVDHRADHAHRTE